MGSAHKSKINQLVSRGQLYYIWLNKFEPARRKELGSTEKAWKRAWNQLYELFFTLADGKAMRPELQRTQLTDAAGNSAVGAVTVAGAVTVSGADISVHS